MLTVIFLNENSKYLKTAICWPTILFAHSKGNIEFKHSLIKWLDHLIDSRYVYLAFKNVSLTTQWYLNIWFAV